MTVSQLTLGDGYKSRDTAFLRMHGVAAGIDYALTCLQGDKVSLQLKFANGRSGPDRLTVMKTHFGANFEEDRQAVINRTYAKDTHFYPEVSAAKPLLPSRVQTG